MFSVFQRENVALSCSHSLHIIIIIIINLIFFMSKNYYVPQKKISGLELFWYKKESYCVLGFVARVCDSPPWKDSALCWWEKQNENVLFVTSAVKKTFLKVMKGLVCVCTCWLQRCSEVIFASFPVKCITKTWLFWSAFVNWEPIKPESIFYWCCHIVVSFVIGWSCFQPDYLN